MDLPPATRGRSGASVARHCHRGPHGSLEHAGRVGAPGAVLHVRKLVAERGHAARRERAGDVLHEVVPHPGAGAVGEDVDGPGIVGPEEDGGHVADAVANVEPELVHHPCHPEGSEGSCQSSRHSRARSLAALGMTAWSLTAAPPSTSPAQPRDPASARAPPPKDPCFSFRIRSGTVLIVCFRMSSRGLTSRHASGTETGAPGSGRTLNGATISLPDPFWR